MVTTKRENVLEPAIFANISKVASAGGGEQNVEWAEGVEGKFGFYMDASGNNSVKHGIKSIIVPDGATSTGNGPEFFGGSESLEKITFPSNISVPAGAVCGCAKLTEVCAPEYEGAAWDGEEHVWDSCLMGNTALTKVRVPFGVTVISGTFAGSSALENLELPPTLRTICNSPFGGCMSLLTLDIPASVEDIDSSAFGASGLTEINIHKPEGSIEGAPWGATNATVNWLG